MYVNVCVCVCVCVCKEEEGWMERAGKREEMEEGEWEGVGHLSSGESTFWPGRDWVPE